MESKESFRKSFQCDFIKENAGKLAQRLRGAVSYQKAGQVFVSPSSYLHQVRINCLLDGKELIMPGPGLKRGFFLLKPHSIPFPKLSFAVSPKGQEVHGFRIKNDEMDMHSIGLCVTESLAVNERGVRIGDGTGYFDLSVAILSEHNALDKDFKVVSVLADGRNIVKGGLPFDQWDIAVNELVTHKSCMDLSEIKPHNPKVYWEKLSLKSIKKMDPLWNLYNKKRDELAKPLT